MNEGLCRAWGFVARNLPCEESVYGGIHPRCSCNQVVRLGWTRSGLDHRPTIVPVELAHSLLNDIGPFFDRQRLHMTVEASPLNLFDISGTRSPVHGPNSLLLNRRIDPDGAKISVQHVGFDPTLYDRGR